LFDDLIRVVARQPLRCRLILTIGVPGDPTNDATRPWPSSTRSIDAGAITINAVQTEAPGNGRDINFDPLVLPDGIAPSDDPLLSARSAVYARSFTRRAGEPKQPSAIAPADVRKGRLNVNRAPPIHRLVAAAALDDGRDGPDHALYRRGHGRLVGR